jgi:predicted acylesterase/phospholipase RssA
MAAYQQHPDLSFDAFFGVSTGALTAAMMAQGRGRDEQLAQLEQLLAIYRGLRGDRDIYRGPSTMIGRALRLVTSQLFAGRPPALFDPWPLRVLIERHIDPVRLAAGVPFACGVVDLADGAYEQWGGGEPDVRDAIMASASIPLLFPPVRIGRWGESRSFDGGLRNMTPLHDAVSWLKKHEDPDKELWVFVTRRLQLLGDYREARDWRPVAIAGRCLTIALNEVYRNDLALLRRRNHQPGYAKIAVTADIPRQDYGHALDFRPAQLAMMVSDGLAAKIRGPRA